MHAPFVSYFRAVLWCFRWFCIPWRSRVQGASAPGLVDLPEQRLNQADGWRRLAETLYDRPGLSGEHAELQPAGSRPAPLRCRCCPWNGGLSIAYYVPGPTPYPGQQIPITTSISALFKVALDHHEAAHPV